MVWAAGGSLGCSRGRLYIAGRLAAALVEQGRKCRSCRASSRAAESSGLQRSLALPAAVRAVGPSGPSGPALLRRVLGPRPGLAMQDSWARAGSRVGPLGDTSAAPRRAAIPAREAEPGSAADSPRGAGCAGLDPRSIIEDICHSGETCPPGRALAQALARALARLASVGELGV